MDLVPTELRVEILKYYCPDEFEIFAWMFCKRKLWRNKASWFYTGRIRAVVREETKSRLLYLLPHELDTVEVDMYHARDYEDYGLYMSYRTIHLPDQVNPFVEFTFYDKKTTNSRTSEYVERFFRQIARTGDMMNENLYRNSQRLITDPQKNCGSHEYELSLTLFCTAFDHTDTYWGKREAFTRDNYKELQQQYKHRLSTVGVPPLNYVEKGVANGHLKVSDHHGNVFVAYEPASFRFGVRPYWYAAPHLMMDNFNPLHLPDFGRVRSGFTTCNVIDIRRELQTFTDLVELPDEMFNALQVRSDWITAFSHYAIVNSVVSSGKELPMSLDPDRTLLTMIEREPNARIYTHRTKIYKMKRCLREPFVESDDRPYKRRHFIPNYPHSHYI